MPDRPETIVAMLTATNLCAVRSSASPDFGSDGVTNRFGQIGPKMPIAVDGYRYNGKIVDIRAKLTEIPGRIHSLGG